MKIAVCIKRVPDSESRIRPSTDGRSLDEAGVKFTINPYDEFAVEEALAVRDRHGGEVVVLSLGPPQAAETLRATLAMGADRAILLETAERSPTDPLVAARALADAIVGESFDLVLCGKVAIDDGGQAVGPMIAELLGLPCIGAIVRLDVGPEGGKAEREIEGGVEVDEFDLPAVLTTEKGLNEPRKPALRGIMLAKKKPLETRQAALDEEGLILDAMGPPPERAPGRIVGEGPQAVAALIDALRDEAKVL